MEHSTPEKVAAAAHAAILDLATRIYIELAVRAASVSDTGVKMTASAENLAKLAFGLAEAFQAVEYDRNEASRPKTGFVMNQVDLASWSKTP